MVGTDLTLGVDGGNTKTVALVTDRQGELIASGRSGCGDIYGVDRPELALGNILAACDQALHKAGALRNDVRRAAFCLAGADWPQDYDYLRSRLNAAFPAASRLLIANDAFGVLAAERADVVGVGIACGTGSAVGGRGPRGVWHMSFWSEPAGGTEIVRRALKAAVQAELGIGPPTTLGRALPAFFGHADIAGLLHSLTRRGGSSLARRASAAPAVMREAQAGDAMAGEIIDDVGRSLGRYARVVADRVGLPVPGYALVVGGGLVRAAEGSLFMDMVRSACGTDDVILTTREPAWGAVFLATRADDVRSWEGSHLPAVGDERHDAQPSAWAGQDG